MPTKPASPFPPRFDPYSKHGAGLLADCIVAFWKARGFPKVTAEPYALRGFGVWGVKSNLFNGLPRGKGRPVGSGGKPQENPREPTRRVLTPRSEPEKREFRR